jgi:hypothetical protein
LVSTTLSGNQSTGPSGSRKSTTAVERTTDVTGEATSTDKVFLALGMSHGIVVAT